MIKERIIVCAFLEIYMKNKPFSMFVIFIFIILFSCVSNQNSQLQTPQQQAVRTPHILLSSAPVYWDGDGGRGIRLAVLEPAGRGLLNTEQWMLSMIQSSITGDFHKYSAMTIIDRQNLEKVLNEQKQSLSENYSDEDYISIGKLTNAKYILTGSITRTTTAYLLELCVTDVETGERRASFTPQAVSPFTLENLSVIKEATTELLLQLGLNLTEQGLQELNRAVNTGRVQAETALARGINAQRHGTVVEALSYFIQANNYDSGLTEAASRMNILAANITSGNIGEDIRNEIAWRRQWIARLQETETFYATILKEPQPFYIVYSTNIQQGTIDFQRETTDLSIWMGFYPDFIWSNQINEVINAVRNGLQATRRAETWGLDWPAKTLGSPSPFNNRTNNSTSTVLVEIINDQGRSIGRQTVRVPYGFEIMDTVVTPLWQWEGNVSFPAVDANFITDTLTIHIASIDGLTAENAARQKRLSVMPQSEWKEVLRANQIIRLNIEKAQGYQRLEELRKRADEYLKNGNIAGAIADYTEVIRLNRNDTTALNDRGVAYWRVGDQNRALEDWNSALGINPNLTQPKLNIEIVQRQRAQVLFEQGKRNFDIRDYVRAITDFTEAIKLNPNLSEAYFQRARSYSAINNFDGAIADYNKVIELNSNEWGAYSNRGRAYNDKKDYTRAISDFTEAIRLNPSHAGSYRDRGFSYLSIAEAHMARGNTSLARNNYNMAIADFTETIRLNPNEAVAYNNRGISYENIGERNRAIADYEAALRLDPNSTLYRNNLRRVRG